MTVLEALPRQSHPMDVMRTACSVLGTVERETGGLWEYEQAMTGGNKDPENTQMMIAERFIGFFPSALLYWYNYHFCGRRIDTNNDSSVSSATHFMKLMHWGKPLVDMHVKMLDASMILYAEHDFNASTFANRVVGSTQSDIYRYSLSLSRPQHSHSLSRHPLCSPASTNTHTSKAAPAPPSARSAATCTAAPTRQLTTS